MYTDSIILRSSLYHTARWIFWMKILLGRHKGHSCELFTTERNTVVFWAWVLATGYEIYGVRRVPCSKNHFLYMYYALGTLLRCGNGLCASSSITPYPRIINFMRKYKNHKWSSRWYLFIIFSCLYLPSTPSIYRNVISSDWIASLCWSKSAISPVNTFRAVISKSNRKLRNIIFHDKYQKIFKMITTVIHQFGNRYSTLIRLGFYSDWHVPVLSFPDSPDMTLLCRMIH